MSACDWFEKEGLLRLERGQPLGDHVESCDACRAARDSYQDLTGTIAEVGLHHRAPEGWQERARAAMGERRRQRRRQVALPAAAAVAAIAVASAFLFIIPAGRPAIALEIAAEDGDDVTMRSETLHPGNRLVLRARPGGRSHYELRVYHNDADLLLRCSNAPPCTWREGQLTARVTLDAVGTYQVVFLASEQTLPLPSNWLDRDNAEAAAAGAEILFKEVQVW